MSLHAHAHTHGSHHVAPFSGTPDFRLGPDLFNRCLAGSATFGLIVLAIILLAPIPKAVFKAVVAPEPVRVAHILMQQKVKPHRAGAKVGLEGPGGPKAGTPGTGALGRTPPQPAPNADAGSNPVPTRGGGGRGIAPGLGSGGGNGTGDLGRARAQELVTSQFAGTASALDKSLSGLTSALATTSGSLPPSNSMVGRRRGPGGARGSADLASVNAGSIASGSADLSGSAVQGSLVSIGSLTGTGGGSGGGAGNGPGTGGYGGGGGIGGGSGGGVGGGSGGGAGDGWAGGGAGGGGGGGSGGGGDGGRGWGGTPGAGGGGRGPGAYRSNASLLAVIQKYQAGIQYCYGLELKRNPTLRGKLVVAITIAASGQVTDATVVSNTLGSPGVSSCALSQIRDWKFPPIAEGITSFQAPFVFTPPE